GGELARVKDAPLTLAPASNREAFPNANWPSWFPHTVPVAFVMANEIGWDSASTGPSPEALGTHLELAAGGAVAEDLAARADVTLALDSATGRVEADLEQVFMQVHDIDLHNHIDMRFG